MVFISFSFLYFVVEDIGSFVVYPSVFVMMSRCHLTPNATKTQFLWTIALCNVSFLFQSNLMPNLTLWCIKLWTSVGKPCGRVPVPDVINRIKRKVTWECTLKLILWGLNTSVIFAWLISKQEVVWARIFGSFIDKKMLNKVILSKSSLTFMSNLVRIFRW